MISTICFSGGSTGTMDSSVLLTESNFIIGLDNESNRELLEKYSDSLRCYPNVVFRFKSSATETEKKEVFKFAEKKGNYTPLAEIAAADLNLIQAQIKSSIPLPVLLFLTSLIAYLSITALMVTKKGKDLSILYLCGASRNKCIATVMGSTALMVVIPSLINAAVLSFLWKLQKQGDERLWGFLFEENCIWLIVFSFVLTLFVVFSVAFASMKGKTPIEILRGVE
jgi:hypothetical protein